jgi:hypothetical protein
LNVRLNELGREVAASTEVEKFKFLRRAVVQEIGPVWIGLHEAPLHQLTQTQAKEVGTDPVAFGLGEVGDFGHALAVHELGSQDIALR